MGTDSLKSRNKKVKKQQKDLQQNYNNDTVPFTNTALYCQSFQTNQTLEGSIYSGQKSTQTTIIQKEPFIVSRQQIIEQRDQLLRRGYSQPQLPVPQIKKATALQQSQSQNKQKDAQALSQKRQRQRKKDMEKVGRADLLSLQARVDNIRVQNKSLNTQISSLKELTKDKEADILNQKEEEYSYKKLQIRDGSWESIYAMRESHLPRHVVKNIKYVEFSVLYITFISRITSLKKDFFEYDRKEELIQKLEQTLKDHWDFHEKMITHNPQLKLQVLNNNIETLQQCARSDKENLDFYIHLIDGLQLTNQQKEKIYYIALRHIDFMADQISMQRNIKESIEQDKQLVYAYLKDNKFQVLNTEDLQLNHDDLQQFSEIQNRILKNQFNAKQSQNYILLQIFDIFQIVEIYEKVYPYLPDIYFFMTIIYAQIKRNSRIDTSDSVNSDIDQVRQHFQDVLNI